MLSSNAPGALALLFILAMVWLRTRLRYPRPRGAGLQLTRAGWGYFAALMTLLAVGWFAAPLLAQYLGMDALVSRAFARAAWFLTVYLAFIPLHRALMARGIKVFRPAAV